MVVARINKTTVESFPSPPLGKRVIVFDDRLKGFGVRVTSSGGKTYIVQYRIGGKGNPTKTHSIGKHGSPWTADTAREQAKNILESVRKGIDPTEAKRRAIRENAATLEINRTLAFNSYSYQFLNRQVTDRALRREKEIRSIFARDLIPYFNSQPITTITKKDIDACLNKIGKRSQSSANKAYRWLKNMFNCAVLDDDVAKSPVDNIKMPFPELPRERVLNDNELRAVWDATRTMGYPFGPLIQLLITTGQRLREVAEAEWSEIDMYSCEWIIPGSRIKNGKKHVVPLGTRTIDILQTLWDNRPDKSKFVFTTNDRTPVSGFSKAKDRLSEKVDNELGVIPPWTFHDLRRTFATGCQKLGIPVEHTEALLNHKISTAGLVGIYQRHDYGPEKKRAVELWDERLAEVVSSKS
jgi:integrase